MSPATIVDLAWADFTFSPWQWPFAQRRRGEIDAHFAARRSRTPELWNGRVLLLRDWHLEGGTLTGTFFETDFASFIAWRDWGFPDEGVTNCFSMGALRGIDGAYLLGVMASYTANPGRVYFPAGTPESEDIAGSSVDLAANVLREVAEETGLTTADFDIPAGWTAVFSGRRIALMKALQARESAESLRERILHHLAQERQPELADIRIVRNRSAFDPNMPEFVTAFLEHVLSA
jgi:8-oxo-dGTP pyrophosphatase MutT (NUDIX family)